MSPELEAKVSEDSSRFDVVTGAGGYTGLHIAEQLIYFGSKVKTITRYPQRCDSRIDILPYFDEPQRLSDSLVGADTVYNTHWRRFPRKGSSTYNDAIRNIEVLIMAAQQAGVRKFVHISVSNADKNRDFPYFRGKWEVEQLIIESGLSYAILRPAIIFGPREILLNNIAYFLGRLHILTIPGNGNYRLQPIFVDDLAKMAIDSAGKNENVAINVAGAEDYTFNQLIDLIKATKRIKAWTPHVHPKIALICARTIGDIIKDEVLTRDELNSLMKGLLQSENPVRGPTSFRQWLDQSNNSIGARYARESDRNHTKS